MAAEEGQIDEPISLDSSLSVAITVAVVALIAQVVHKTGVANQKFNPRTQVRSGDRRMQEMLWQLRQLLDAVLGLKNKYKFFYANYFYNINFINFE